MTTPLTCTVVSPERTYYHGPASKVIVPGWDGELGVLTGHAALVAKLGVGVVRIHTADSDAGAPADAARDAAGTVTMAVRGGFLQVLHDDVKLLVTEALTPDDISPDAVRTRHTALLERLQSPGGDAEFAELLTERRWLETQLAL